MAKKKRIRRSRAGRPVTHGTMQGTTEERKNEAQQEAELQGTLTRERLAYRAAERLRPIGRGVFEADSASHPGEVVTFRQSGRTWQMKGVRAGIYSDVSDGCAAILNEGLKLLEAI